MVVPKTKWPRANIPFPPHQWDGLQARSQQGACPSIVFQVREAVQWYLDHDAPPRPVAAPVTPPAPVEPPPVVAALVEPVVAAVVPPDDDDLADRTGMTSRQKVKLFQEDWNDCVDAVARGRIGKMRDLPRSNSTTLAGQRFYKQVVEFMTRALLRPPHTDPCPDYIVMEVMKYWMKLPIHDGPKRWTWTNFIPNFEKHLQAVLDSSPTISAIWDGVVPPAPPLVSQAPDQRLCFKCGKFFDGDQCPGCGLDPEGNQWWRRADRGPDYVWPDLSAPVLTMDLTKPVCPDCQTSHGVDEYCAIDEDALL